MRGNFFFFVENEPQIVRALSKPERASLTAPSTAASAWPPHSFVSSRSSAPAIRATAWSAYPSYVLCCMRPRDADRCKFLWPIIIIVVLIRAIAMIYQLNSRKDRIVCVPSGPFAHRAQASSWECEHVRRIWPQLYRLIRSPGRSAMELDARRELDDAARGVRGRHHAWRLLFDRSVRSGQPAPTRADVSSGRTSTWPSPLRSASTGRSSSTSTS